MTRIRARCRSLALHISVMALSVVPCAADWHRVDSPNFVVIGDLPGGDLKTVAKKFEGFRETLTRVLREEVTATAVPTVVIVFPSDRAFTPFKMRYQGKAISQAGVFVGRSDVNYIGLVYGGEESLRIVFHEYAHLVIANTTRNLPVWLNEGLAEYFSTYEEGANGREALIGRAISNHLLRLNDTRLFPLAELRQVGHDSPQYNERERQSVFYAQAWALTHMLRIGLPDRTRQLITYVNSLGNGLSEPEAWDRAFGSDNLEKALKGYIGQASFRATRYTFQTRLSTLDVPVQNVSLGDGEALLADFLIRMRRPDEAAERLAKAAKAGAAGPSFTVVSAALDLDRDDHASAEKRLLALGPVEDWLPAYFAGVGLADLAQRQPQSAQVEQLAAAQRFFDVVRRSRGQIPNAVAREATMALRQSVEPPAAIRTAIEQAIRSAPGRDDYALLYARVLARQSAFAAAKSVLASLMSNAYPPHVRDTARSLSTYVGSLESAAKRRAASDATTTRETRADVPGAPTDRTLAPPNAPTDLSLEEAVFKPTFREVGGDERRIEGVLQRIDCAVKNVTFHLRTAEGVVQARATSLTDIEFVTFRDDIKGNVTCGPLPSPMRVYVTVRKPARDAPEVVVAIEYLPK